MNTFYIKYERINKNYFFINVLLLFIVLPNQTSSSIDISVIEPGFHHY